MNGWLQRSGWNVRDALIRLKKADDCSEPKVFTLRTR